MKYIKKQVRLHRYPEGVFVGHWPPRKPVAPCKERKSYIYTDGSHTHTPCRSRVGEMEMKMRWEWKWIKTYLTGTLAEDAARQTLYTDITYITEITYIKYITYITFIPSFLHSFIPTYIHYVTLRYVTFHYTILHTYYVHIHKYTCMYLNRYSIIWNHNVACFIWNWSGKLSAQAHHWGCVMMFRGQLIWLRPIVS